MPDAEFANLTRLVHARGRLTVAAFMDLALYHPRFGYYARAARRSGRAGDFFTSVDVGSVFGELLALQIVEMAADFPVFDLVEAGAGNGRLAAAIMAALASQASALHARTRLHLVDASPAARAAQPATLGSSAANLVSSSADLPASFSGVLVANELLDALPVHQAVWQSHTVCEVFVTSDGETLRVVEDQPSTPRIAEYVDALRRIDGVTLLDGQRIEVPLAACDWLRTAAARLTRGFLLIIDYGQTAGELFSPARVDGTLTTYHRHIVSGPADRTSDGRPAWLQDAGERDITAHVDFSALQRVAAAAGLQSLGLVDQTYFLMGILEHAVASAGPPGGPGTPGEPRHFEGHTAADARRRLALKTLLLPGGLGSTMKVLVLAKDVGPISLSGLRRGRLT